MLDRPTAKCVAINMASTDQCGQLCAAMVVHTSMVWAVPLNRTCTAPIPPVSGRSSSIHGQLHIVFVFRRVIRACFVLLSTATMHVPRIFLLP